MPIPDDDPVLDEHTERELAKRLFNRVWDLLEQPTRTGDEDELMVNAAHSSLYHWTRVGEPVNEVRGEWQVSDEDREIFLGDLVDLRLGRF